MKTRNYLKDILFGISFGDTLGVPVEFESRKIFK
jgi:ADP-ribosylglycohydrolase